MPELEDICGFSMGRTTPLACIKGRCHHWKDTEKEVRKSLAGIGSNLSKEELESEIVAEIKRTTEDLGEGWCVFDCLDSL